MYISPTRTLHIVAYKCTCNFNIWHLCSRECGTTNYERVSLLKVCSNDSPAIFSTFSFFLCHLHKEADTNGSHCRNILCLSICLSIFHSFQICPSSTYFASVLLSAHHTLCWANLAGDTYMCFLEHSGSV